MDECFTEDISSHRSCENQSQLSTPFFSIGVTTYNRRELLKCTLDSILKQTFFDFEVIIGNDYVQEILSAELLGIQDPRIRFVNHPQNLGEVGNMNALLNKSRGRYFTWLADDDLYEPNFLQALYSALERFNFPSCAFSSYRIIEGTELLAWTGNISTHEELLSGRRFLRMYMEDKLKVIGPYGVFDTDILRQMGGVESLSDAPIGLYGEYILLVRCGLLKNITYIDSPLVLYRSPEKGNYGGGVWANTNISQYKEAGKNLIFKSVEVLSKPELRKDFYNNLSFLLKFSLRIYANKLAFQNGCVNIYDLIAQLSSIKEQFKSLKGSVLYWIALFILVQEGLHLVWYAKIPIFKQVAPHRLVKIARSVYSFLIREQRRDFRDK